MTGTPGVILKLYGILLYLYPASFRNEFQEQMLLDFTDMVVDAQKKGQFSFALFCLRELVDFPANLLRVHLKEGFAFRMLRSQPLNYRLRNALVFGIAFGLAGLITEFVFLKLVVPDNAIFGLLQIYYYDLFHTEHGFEFLNWLPSALGSILTGIVIGIAFAFLFADRTKWVKYALVCMLCWFLHQEVFNVWFYAANLPFYLGTRHFIILRHASSIFSGTFLARLCPFNCPFLAV